MFATLNKNVKHPVNCSIPTRTTPMMIDLRASFATVYKLKSEDKKINKKISHLTKIRKLDFNFFLIRANITFKAFKFPQNISSQYCYTTKIFQGIFGCLAAVWNIKWNVSFKQKKVSRKIIYFNLFLLHQIEWTRWNIMNCYDRTYWQQQIYPCYSAVMKKSTENICQKQSRATHQYEHRSQCAAYSLKID